MKTLLCIALLLVASVTWAQQDDVIEIEVKGMTCAFCVYAVEKNLKRLSEVSNAEVSMSANKARITFEKDQDIDLAVIRQAILDAGMTPGDVLTP